jgi:hypothetical protein
VGHHHSGCIKKIKLDRARALLDGGDPLAALRILAGGYHYFYDVDYYELFGCVLLECGEIDNAGRFLFLSGVRRPEYEAAINSFLSKNSDPNNFRQLQSQLTKKARVMWKLKQFPPTVASDLRSLGWPEDTQAEIVARKHAFLNKKTINSILLDLNSKECIEKDILVSTLSDFLDANSVAIEDKQRIADNVMDLHDPKNNSYELQESIFYCLGNAISNRVRQEQIANIMLDYLSIPDADIFVSYAIDALMDTDLQFLDRNHLVENYSNSPNPHIRREISLYAE